MTIDVNRELAELIADVGSTEISEGEVTDIVQNEIHDYLYKMKEYFAEFCVFVVSTDDNKQNLHGKYFRKGSHNGQPYYKKQDGEFYLYYSGGDWNINSELNDETSICQSTTDDEDLFDLEWETVNAEGEWIENFDIRVTSKGLSCSAIEKWPIVVLKLVGKHKRVLESRFDCVDRI